MPASHSVFTHFKETAARWPERAFLNVLPETAAVYGIAAREWSYGDVLSRVEALSAEYRAAGYGPGHRIGLLLQNRPDFVLHWLALNGVGASIVPINPDLRDAELRYLISHSEMALAVCVADRASDLAAASDGLSIIGPDDPVPPAASASEQLIREVGEVGEVECALLYTSGTTGRPKGCVLTNHYFTNAGAWYADVGGHLTLHRDPPERMLTPLPLFHVNALAFSAMAVMTVGGCLTVLDRFHPRTWWDSVQASGATVIHYLGVMPPMLLAQTPSPQERNHHIRFGFGAGIDPSLHVAAEERFGFAFVEGWAMTETGAGGVIMATTGERRPGTATFGQPGPGVEARVLLESGADAKPEEPGELLVRRAGDDPRSGFFSEYLKDPEATAAAWSGGYLNTGDIVTRDADGFYRFVDRKKNIVRRSGENISAAEVESILGCHPWISSVAITPVRDAIREEEVFALVTGPEPSADTAQQIAEWAVLRMAYYKAPGWIAFVDTLPVTATEKLQRGAIRALAADLLARGQAYDTRPLKRRAQ